MAGPSARPATLTAEERHLAVACAREVLLEGRFASDVLARVFREARRAGHGLAPAREAAVAGFTHAWLRAEPRLRAIAVELVPAAAHATPERRDALLGLVLALRRGEAPAALAGELAALAPGVPPAAFCAEDAGLAGLAGRAREALRLGLPEWLLARLEAALGAAAARAFADASAAPAPRTLRANRARIDRDALARRLAADGIATRPCALAPDGLRVESDAPLFRNAAFAEGLFEQMDEASQLVAEAVAPPPGGRVLDACAGAGGKSLALAAALGHRGAVLALDVSEAKLRALRRRARRAGTPNLAARRAEADARPAAARAAAFDRVLVDAPCSGLGTLRRNPERLARLAEPDLRSFAATQRALLERYAPCVAAGGRLVYATCSVLPEENEEVVADFLAAHPEFAAMPLKEIWGSQRAAAAGDGLVLRTRPDTHDADGFFAAVLRRAR